MITLLKLGGSLITDKTRRASFRQAVMARLAQEIRAGLNDNPEMQLIIGHGSGSFGHFEARVYNTIQGVKTVEQWVGFARVATIAAELNYLVARELHQATIPAFRIQPSASVAASDGIITDMNITNIRQTLERGLVPLVYGDVAFDDVRGGTILSTEIIFTYLVSQLPVSRIILLGEVDGVYDANRQVIERITPANFENIQAALGGSVGVDVTGGMLTKVQEMLKLATHEPYPVIQIINGNSSGITRRVLRGEAVLGTIITNA